MWYTKFPVRRVTKHLSRKEVGNGVDVQLKEHRSGVKFHRTSSAIVQNIEDYHNLPAWNEAKFLEKSVKTNKGVLEAAHIITRNAFNSRHRFVICSSAAENWRR